MTGTAGDSVRIAELEASGRAALPALHEERVGGWLFRVSGGDTKRVNSAHCLDRRVRVDEAIGLAEPLYRARGLPCRFRLNPLAHADADGVLADAGYEVVDPSLTMVAALTSGAIDPELALAFRPDQAWLDRVEPLSGRSPAAALVQAQLLAAMPGPLALAALEEDGVPIAAGYASSGHGRTQLSDIVVAPHARGRGLGRRLVAGLLGWAHQEGCREAMLQVLASNVAARRLYCSLGFVDAYPYHYRVRQ